MSFDPGPYVGPVGDFHLVGWKYLSDRQTEYIDDLGAAQTEWSEIYIFRWINRATDDAEDRGNPSADDVLRQDICPKLFETADELQQRFGDRYNWRDGKIRNVQCKEVQRIAPDLDWTAPADPAYGLPQESLWEVLVNLTTDIQEKEGGPPHLRRPEYEWSTETLQVMLWEDAVEEEVVDEGPPETKEPLPVENANKQQMVEEGPETLGVLRVMRYEGPGRNYDPTNLFKWANHVNKFYFFGAPPKCALCTSVTAEEEYMTWVDPDTKEKVSDWYNRVEYIFKFKFRWKAGEALFPEDPENLTEAEEKTTAGWMLKLLHVGTKVRQEDPNAADDSYIIPMDENKNVETDDVMLTIGQPEIAEWPPAMLGTPNLREFPLGSGFWIKPEWPEADKIKHRNWIYFNRYPVADFRLLESTIPGAPPFDYTENPDNPDPPDPTTTSNVAAVNDPPVLPE